MKGNLTFKAGSRQDKKLVIIMGGILGFTALFGLLLLFNDAVGALILFGTTLFGSSIILDNNATAIFDLQ